MQQDQGLPLRSRIMEVVPRDTQFTLANVVDLLDEDVSHATVRTTLQRLIERGDIKRVQRGNARSPAVFVVAGSPVRINQLNVVSQIKAAELVLRQMGRPAELADLVDEMLRRGFTPTSDLATLKKSLAESMNLKSQFVKNGNRWSLTSP